jgi:DNA-binding NtrC family response regulator
MQRPWDVLVVSKEMENRKALQLVLEQLSLNVIQCSDLVQASEVLSRQPVELVFCDDSLSDGTYRDLLPPKKQGRKPRLVVMMRTGEWEEYVEAMRLGAFDAMRRSWHPTDVELLVLLAMHEEQKADLASRGSKVA